MNGLRFSGLLLAITLSITLTATVGCVDDADAPYAPVIGGSNPPATITGTGMFQIY